MKVDEVDDVDRDAGGALARLLSDPEALTARLAKFG
jgi:hypothetical protein